MGAFRTLKGTSHCGLFFYKNKTYSFISLIYEQKKSGPKRCWTDSLGADVFRLLDSILIIEPDSLCHCFNANSTTPRWPLSVNFSTSVGT